MVSNANGVINMNVISEQLNGEHSFRGLGYVEIDGLSILVCGSKRLDCGNGNRVRYFDKQIKRVNAEVENRAEWFVTLETGAGFAEPVVIEGETAKPLLFNGFRNRLYMGADIDGTFVYTFPGMEFVFINSSNEEVSSSMIDTTTASALNPATGYYGLRMKSQ